MKINSFTRTLKNSFKHLSNYEIEVVKNFMTSGEKQNKKAYVKYINHLYDNGELLTLEYNSLMDFYL